MTVAPVLVPFVEIDWQTLMMTTVCSSELLMVCSQEVDRVVLDPVAWAPAPAETKATVVALAVTVGANPVNVSPPAVGADTTGDAS